MTRPIVRAATLADIAGILPMVGAIGAMHEKLDPERYAMLPDVVARYKRWLPQRITDSRSVLLVGEVDNRLAGFLVAGIETNIPIYRLTEFAFIHDVWVEPGFRRQGVAGALVDEAIQRFKDNGIRQVRLETAAVNEDARRLFASRGFRVGTIDMLRELS